jgi:hypothetical protein
MEAENKRFLIQHRAATERDFANENGSDVASLHRHTHRDEIVTKSSVVNNMIHT